MGKGSKRRPGRNFEAAYIRIFGVKTPKQFQTGKRYRIGVAGSRTVMDNGNMEYGAYGCHPNQVEEFNMKYGHTGMKWQRNGKPIAKDMATVKRYRKAYGYPT